jgi:hypothetical protein
MLLGIHLWASLLFLVTVNAVAAKEPVHQFLGSQLNAVLRLEAECVGRTLLGAPCLGHGHYSGGHAAALTVAVRSAIKEGVLKS